ncbi:hypothetical protein FACS1894191_5490 [Clostridia bacterium]|nr:hypothetical protein FACS1894191_5490 [Clostridia bacterium]
MPEEKTLDLSEKYDCMKIFDVKTLFTNARINRSEAPDGLYLYHIRHDDNGEFATLEQFVGANHAASILSSVPLLGDEEYRPISYEDYNFAVDGEDEMTISEYSTEQDQEQAPLLEM